MEENKFGACQMTQSLRIIWLHKINFNNMKPCQDIVGTNRRKTSITSTSRDQYSRKAWQVAIIRN